MQGEFKIPNCISMREIESAKEKCIREAEKRSANNGWIMSYCGYAKSWEECFSCLVLKDKSVWILFQFNVGHDTKATKEIVYPKKNK
jgi:hypothetical protein